MSEALQRTPLYDLHLELGAKMVPFSGYEMPVQYETGILAEHQYAREGAVLFDVSHMGQAELHGADAAARFETLVPGDITGLGQGRIRYTQLTNDAGGIIDDLMVTRRGDQLFLVVNAGQKEIDYRHIGSSLGENVHLTTLDTRALIALQGPMAADVLGALCVQAKAMAFMTMIDAELGGADCFISRSGYTGEDGFEISVPADKPPASPGCFWARTGFARPASGPGIRFAWKPDFASMATISTKPPRRWKPASPGPYLSAGAKKADFRAPVLSWINCRMARLENGWGFAWQAAPRPAKAPSLSIKMTNKLVP